MGGWFVWLSVRGLFGMDLFCWLVVCVWWSFLIEVFPLLHCCWGFVGVVWFVLWCLLVGFDCWIWVLGLIGGFHACVFWFRCCLFWGWWFLFTCLVVVYSLFVVFGLVYWLCLCLCVFWGGFIVCG